MLDSLTTGIPGIPWGPLDVGRGDLRGRTDRVRLRRAAPAPASATLPPMTGLLGQRLVLLAAIALVGALVALAIVERRQDASAGLTGAAAPAGWNTAFAGSRGPSGDAQRTTCGHVLSTRSLGVTHPVLPCGAKLILRNGDTQVLTEVIDNTLVEGGRQLEVTQALAQLLDLEDTEEIEWRFATDSSG
jgi:hypothetical protein